LLKGFRLLPRPLLWGGGNKQLIKLGEPEAHI
jgi:hypothetical protein